VKSKITANLGLRIISLFFAFILWLVVNNIENPTVTESYVNIPVKLLNTDLITDAGKVYEVIEGTDVVDRVSVKAPKSVHSSLNAGDITATADVSELSSLDTISIKFSSDAYGEDIESIKGSIDTVKLNIENKRSKTLALKAGVSGSVAEGHLVGEVTTDQNLVRISGPESLIDRVVRAAVEIDVSGFTNDIGTNLDIRLYDSEDRLVQDSRISQNIKSVGVNVNIYQTTEVPIYFEVSGTPTAGYRVSGEPVGNLQTIKIAGKGNIIRNVTAIEVPAEEIDVTGQSADFVTEVNVREFLPDNVFLADASQAKIQVSVSIEQEVSREISVSGKEVELINVPEGFRATVAEIEDGTTIDVIGLSRDVSAIRANELKATFDILKWMEEQEMEEAVDGYYNVEIDFGLGDNVTVLEPLVLVLHLSEITE